ncbi:hypothetical protein RB195_002113 [Necator americanus]|uniref:Uncharacterized protein n=1 Tax=Necator americanus TaxID=51031 RepID=A0ABR1DHE6_NECAM
MKWLCIFMLIVLLTVANCLHDLMWNGVFISTTMPFTSFYVKHHSMISGENTRLKTYTLSNDSKSCLYYIGIEGVLKASFAVSIVNVYGDKRLQYRRTNENRTFSRI